MDISIVKCEDYSPETVSHALNNLLELSGGLDWVTPNMNIVIKANLVTFMKPDLAGTTHPALLCELVKKLCEKGANVIVGDSPGGIYTSAFVNKVYSVTGMNKVKEFGGKLNENFEQKSAIFENGKVLKEFDEIIGLDHIKVIHLNDSLNDCGTHKDRHANIGFGKIGFNTLLKFALDPRFNNIPKILETPYIKNGDDSYPPYFHEIKMLKSEKFNDNLINEILNERR